MAMDLKEIEKFIKEAIPDALIEMKKILWKDTSNWKTLLEERAAISGQLVLSLFTKNALAKFKK